MYWVAIEIVVQNVKFLSLFLLLFLHVSWPGSEVSVSNTVRGLAAGGCMGYLEMRGQTPVLQNGWCWNAIHSFFFLSSTVAICEELAVEIGTEDTRTD